MNRIVRSVLPLLVIVFGVLVAAILVATRPRPQREEVPPTPTRVRVEVATVEDRPVLLPGMGTVVSAREIDLRPEITGRVVEHAPAMMPGGLVRRGDLLVQIDDRDYRVALDQASSRLERARFDLIIELGRQKIAEREFDLVKGGDLSMSDAEAELALRRPHLRNVQAALRAAESDLELAKLNLARTRVKAPFDAIIQEENVAVGQLVNPQASLAKLVATDVFRVQVAVPVASTAGFGLRRAEVRRP
ncbi:MAG: HlyD family efflux transporter periplasmic adaptor subunit [Myxococcales bacterium]|nr:HlyD family efflux transporter periplasmic adaptor subunit [Myxococcales bacterium]